MVKTLLYQLKPEIKKWLLIKIKNLPIINLSMKMRKTIGFINAYILRKKINKNINRLIRKSIFPKGTDFNNVLNWG
ncbi:hypothetical protein C5467_01745 [Photorhabdus khanii subsp. guanajuatensis]|uniref:Uncharacterized protein n=1 Tax=Photorhabdus khanii subsp. guanajuatensis TaxID=2100166 RepID=A0A4R4K4V5_9GAMM|nr:hypothetical protein C5467_01745 [Photorhabdus khanii subsp. guanajuatensis]